MSQLGNKIQHALRAYTPKDQKAVRAAAASFRPNPDFNSETTLGELSTGEALISALDENGAPQIVQRAFILPPKSYMGAASPERINELVRKSPLYSKYGQAIDNISAYEVLQKNQKQTAAPPQVQKAGTTQQQKQPVKEKAAKKTANPVNKALSSAMTQIGREAGKALIRGLFGNIKK